MYKINLLSLAVLNSKHYNVSECFLNTNCARRTSKTLSSKHLSDENSFVVLATRVNNQVILAEAFGTIEKCTIINFCMHPANSNG